MTEKIASAARNRSSPDERRQTESDSRKKPRRDSGTPLTTRKTTKAKKSFWNKRRLKTISSMPCRELLQAMEDGGKRTAKELALMTGRTPGALHSPLQKLCEAEIVLRESKKDADQRRGRPAQVFSLNPIAAQGMSREDAADGLLPDASGKEAALRLLNRKVKSVATENKDRVNAKEQPLVNLCSIEYGFLNDREIERIEKKFLEIHALVSKKRSDSTGKKKRVRLGMIMVED